MPHFRQFPIDGLNYINDISIFFQAVNKQEKIHIKVASQKYKQFTKKTTFVGAPEIAELTFPSHLLARFIVHFFDISRIRLTPAMNDVQQNDHTLMSKQIQISDLSFFFQIYISQGTNGLERLVLITLTDNNNSRKSTTIRIPWIRMTDVFNGLRQVHQELQNSAFV